MSTDDEQPIAAGPGAGVAGRVRAAQGWAWEAANREVLTLYWTVGADLVRRRGVWDDEVLATLAGDLAAEFPDQHVWTTTNLVRMRQAATVWPTLEQFLAAVGHRGWDHITALLARQDHQPPP
jgi:hypothetical protein